jgi:hypothetical protein
MNIGGAKVALVSEVLDRLLDEFGGESARRSVLFQAALQVCADESRRVKQGQPPAPLEVLVQRARAVLDAPQGQTPPERAGAAAPPAAPVELPPIPQEELLHPMPEPPEPVGMAPELFVDEGMYEEVVPQRRRLPIPIVLGVLLLLAVAAGTYFAYSRYESQSRQPTPPRIAESFPPPQSAQPRQAEAAKPTAIPLPPTPVPTVALPEPVEPRAPVKSERLARSAAPARWEGVQVMVSPDWVGRAPVYVVHFSSYREREKARRDAARIGQRYGRPTHVAQVELASGIWYRVVVGDFASAEQARAFHAELAARNTPDLGGVYRLTAP